MTSVRQHFKICWSCSIKNIDGFFCGWTY